jgi:hypothetical protein
MEKRGSLYKLVHLGGGYQSLGKVTADVAKRLARKFGKSKVKLVRIKKSGEEIDVKF